jgi:hypothetical protein
MTEPNWATLVFPYCESAGAIEKSRDNYWHHQKERRKEGRKDRRKTMTV